MEAAHNGLLRQAVAYSIPYDDIVKFDYLGFARRMYSQVPSTFDGYVANMTYQTDLTRPRRCWPRRLPRRERWPTKLGAAALLCGSACVAARAGCQPDQNNLASIGVNITSSRCRRPVRRQAAADRRHAYVTLRFLLAVRAHRCLCHQAALPDPLDGWPGRSHTLLDKALDALSTQAQTASGATLTTLTTQMQNPHDRPPDHPARRGAARPRHGQAANRLVPGARRHRARVLLRHQLGLPRPPEERRRHGHQRWRAVPHGRARGSG